MNGKKHNSKTPCVAVRRSSEDYRGCCVYWCLLTEWCTHVL